MRENQSKLLKVDFLMNMQSVDGSNSFNQLTKLIGILHSEFKLQHQLLITLLEIEF